MATILSNPSPAAEQRAISIEDVVISDKLLSRPMHKVDARAEIAALHGLAELLPRGRALVLKQLARLAIDLCGAGTGGISMLEAANDGRQVFRWEALAGELETHEGGSTPGDWSPCGECLKAGRPMLYSDPGRYFTYFREAGANIVEGLVIPMYSGGLPIGTIWVVTHDKRRKFDAEDVRVMTMLGAFVTAAMRLSLPEGMNGIAKAGIKREIVWGELVRRIADGDAAALEALIDETRPLVFAKALRILSSPADAEETAADVYSQVWTIAARYDPQRYNVTAWLLNISRSRAIDRLRSRASREQRSESALCLLCASMIDPESDEADFETRINVRRALQGLTVEQRQAIEMAYFDGYTMAEIASRLSRPLGTVKTHIRTGLIALRRLIAAIECRVPQSNSH